MSFTQKDRVNAGKDKCDGCEKQCEFKVITKVRCRAGESIGSGHTTSATIEDMYPVLGGEPLYHYVDEAGRHIYPWTNIRNNIVEIDGKLVIARPEVRSELARKMLEYARKASTLCDHYKSR